MKKLTKVFIYRFFRHYFLLSHMIGLFLLFDKELKFIGVLLCPLGAFLIFFPWISYYILYILMFIAVYYLDCFKNKSAKGDS